MPKQHQQRHMIHPTTLDSGFQVAYTVAPQAGTSSPKVPRSIGRLWISNNISTQPGSLFTAYSDLGHYDSQTVKTDITVTNDDDGETADLSVISIDGFVCQSIGPAQASEQKPWEYSKLVSARWGPDITFIKPSFLKKQLGTPLSHEEAKMMIDLRQVCLLYIVDALRDLTPVDIKRLEWYQRKFYIYMRLQAELARTNELAPDSSLWGGISL